jgi:hypothetical protein
MTWRTLKDVSDEQYLYYVRHNFALRHTHISVQIRTTLHMYVHSHLLYTFLSVRRTNVNVYNHSISFMVY